MRGVVFLGDRELEIRDFPDPVPDEREVIVRLRASAMCGSDLKSYRASREHEAHSIKSCIRGHEPSGVVHAVGAAVEETEARVGDRVMIHHYSGCGVCRYCRTGWPQMCPVGFKIYGGGVDGGHADFIRVLPRMLIPLPDALSFEVGAAISCGTGTAYQGLRRLHISGEDTLAIFGQGPVGLSATMFGVAMGARVIAVDPSRPRRELAAEFGAHHTIDPNEVPPTVAILDLTHGAGVQASIDCSGTSDGRLGAVRSAAKWGRVCMVGSGGTTEFDITSDFIRKQLSIYGSWALSTSAQESCANFAIERGVQLDRLFTHRFDIDDAQSAYELFDTQSTGKGVFLFS